MHYYHAAERPRAVSDNRTITMRRPAERQLLKRTGKTNGLFIISALLLEISKET
jgi:hypothetical protein